MLSTCSPVAFISTSSLGQTHAHTHTECRHKHTVYTNTCSAWGHKHKQGTQAPETPLFPVWVCVPMLSMCVYTHVLASDMFVCACVCVCVQPRADAEMKTKYKNTLTISTLLLCLFRPGRGVTCVPWRKVSSHVEPLFILWSLREISQLLRVLRDTGLCCSDCEAGTHPWNFLSLDNDSAWGVSRCKTHYLPGAVYAMWVHCSPGTLEDALCLRGVSIRVPPPRSRPLD